MRILIRELHAAADQTAALGRVADVQLLRIGRGSDQDIELNDLQLGLAHAELLRVADSYLLRPLGRDGLRVNERVVGEVLVAPGDVIDCGRYRLTLGPGTSDAELTIDVEERLSAKSARGERLGTLRTQLMPQVPTRALAWSAFAIVLIAFLLSPLLWRYASDTPPRASVPALTDVAWTPGPSSRAHAFMINDCAQCHRAPFERVSNDSCADCHGALPHHGIREASLNTQELSELRCASCHAEHNGDALVVTKAELCTSCHADARERFGDLQMADVSDFMNAHPTFAPTLATFDADQQGFLFAAQRMGARPLSEDTGLFFPHDTHLAAEGISSPDGKKVLECQSCHVPERSGVSFEPITMEKHCSACHRLDFDPDDPDRVLPHAKPDEIAAQLRDYYGRKGLAGGIRDPNAPAVVRERRKPGEELDRDRARAAMAWAEARAKKTVDEVFDRRVCVTCHVVVRDPEEASGWRVAPVQLSEHALRHAKFSHAPHAGEECASCHAAPHSKSSSDVLLPDITRCRDCHGGEQTTSQVPSTCLMCHDFHRAGAPAMAPGGQPPRHLTEKISSRLPMPASATEPTR